MIAYFFDSGDDVQKGAKLVQLDTSVEEADLANNKATLLQANLDFERQSKLVKTGAVSQAVLDATIAKRDTAAASVAKMDAIIAEKNIIAPFAGRLGLRRVEKGQYVTTGQALVWLQSLDPIWVDFPVPEGDMGKFKEGSPIEIAVDAFRGKIFKGEVEAFDARLSSDSRTLMVRGRVPNPDRTLLPGMFANAAVLAGEPKDVVTVPRTALTYTLYGDSVWVVKEGLAEPAATRADRIERARRLGRRGGCDGGGADGAQAHRRAALRARRIHAGRPDRHPRRRERRRRGGDQRPAQIAAGRRNQDRQQPRRSSRRRSCPSNNPPMHFTDLFIKRPVLATVVSLMILLIGAWAGFKLPIRQYPELSNTTITVTTTYPGANADLIQGFITVPIQQAVASAEGIDTLVATSTQNVSTVTLNLKLDADPDRAMTDVLSKIAQVKSILPREANDSVVTKQTGEGYALMYLSFNSKVMNSSQISDYLNRVVQPKLQTINGVANAQILGGQTFAMRIWLDPDRMASLGVTPLDVRARARQPTTSPRRRAR